MLPRLPLADSPCLCRKASNRRLYLQSLRMVSCGGFFVGCCPRHLLYVSPLPHEFMKAIPLFLSLGFCFLSSPLFAKSEEILQPPSREKRMGMIDPAAFGFGQPGFVADLSVVDHQEFQSQPGGLDFMELRTIAPIVAKKWGDFLVAGSIGYALTDVDFHEFGGLQDETLHTLEAQITVAWRPENNPWSALGFVTPGLGTDFRGISWDDVEFTGLGLINYRVQENLSLAGGVFGRYAADDNMIVPALGFIWKCEPFIVQMTPPFAVIGWHATERLTLSLSAYPSGGAWDLDDSEVNRVNINGWQTAASVIYQLTDHLTLSLRGGVNLSGEVELQDANHRVIKDEDLETAPFSAINLRYSF